MSTVVSLICLGSSFQKMIHHFLLHGSLPPTNLEKKLKSCTYIPGHIAQSVASPTAEPEVASLTPARSHTFVEIDHEIISMVNLLLPLSRRVVVKQKYVHEVLVNHLVKLARENSVVM